MAIIGYLDEVRGLSHVRLVALDRSTRPLTVITVMDDKAAGALDAIFRAELSALRSDEGSEIAFRVLRTDWLADMNPMDALPRSAIVLYKRRNPWR